MRPDTHDRNCSRQSDITIVPLGPGKETFEGAVTSVPDLKGCVVRHCSPTLAGLKCGSLFRVESGLHGIFDQLLELERKLASRGVSITTLRIEKDSTLLYVYRPALLTERLSEKGVMDFLARYDYAVSTATQMVAQLAERFTRCINMPPEAGIFLDYPLEDVIGYIENEGRCSRCIGCWKVYGDVESAERRFQSYKKCREVFTRKYDEGCCISKLAIRA